MGRKHSPPFKHQTLVVPRTAPERLLKVLVCVPSTGLWFADFGNALCNMFAAFSMFRVEGWDRQVLFLNNVKGSILPKSRWLSIQEALEKECQFFCFIDSDQTFPRKMLHHMIKRMTELKIDVLAANIATKTIPAQPTARMKDPAGDPSKWVTVYTDPESTGVQRVDRIGTGIMMLTDRAMKKVLPQDLDMKWREDVKSYQGEDWWLTQGFEREGIPIYIDHDLSKDVGHVGFFNYTHDVVGEIARDVRNPEPAKSKEAA